MDFAQHNLIVNFIWNVADDVLRDVYVRGKYRDVILPFLEKGGMKAFFIREVQPRVPDAWIDETATKIGYEISFTRYFYKPQPLRSLHEIGADIVALETAANGLLGEISGGPVL